MLVINIFVEPVFYMKYLIVCEKPTTLSAKVASYIIYFANALGQDICKISGEILLSRIWYVALLV